MSLTFTPRSLLQVGSLLTHDDPNVADGWHIVIRTHEALGLPLHPFVALPLTSVEMTDLLLYREDGVRARLPINPADNKIVRVGDPVTLSDPRIVAIAVTVAPGSNIQVCVTEAGHPERIIAQRTLPDTSNSLICRFPISGRAQLLFLGSGLVTDIIALRFNGSIAELFSPPLEPVRTFGLPIEGDHRWYVGGEGPDRALARVEEGAPRRLSPIDRPDGTLVATAPSVDVKRVRAMADTVLKAVAVGVDHPSPDPRERRWGETGSTLLATDQSTVSLSAPAALQTFAGDPSLARFLGFSLPVRSNFDRETIWAVAALFAVEPQDALGGGTRLGDVLMPMSQDMAALRETLMEFYQPVKDVAHTLEQVNRVVVPIIGVALPAELDQPSPPKLSAWSSAWHTRTSRRTSATQAAHVGWRQIIELSAPRRLGMLAVTRDHGTGLILLNQAIPNFPEHHVPIFSAGQPKGSAKMPLPANAIVDLGVPESASAATWTIFAADEFGRWADSESLTAAAPTRPRPPVPRPQVLLVRNDSDPGPTGKHSPGTIRIIVPVPSPNRLAPGAMPIEKIEIVIAGLVSRTFAPPDAPATEIMFDIAAPALALGEMLPVAWTVRFRDALPPVSPNESTAQGTLEIRDGRRPLPQQTSRTLIWTTRRDATGQAELALGWSATAPAYHVWLTSEETLRAPLNLTDPAFAGLPRAVRATRIYDALQDRGVRQNLPDDRPLFTRLTDRPITASNDTVEYRFALLGASDTVNFLRIVPISATGVEAPFASCGIIPVAVPGEAVPPPPTVVVRTDQGRVHVDITVGGIDTALLKRLQQTDSAAPECRIRRVMNRTTDPLYFCEVGRVNLEVSAAEPGVWTASFVDSKAGTKPLPTFVSLAYVAELRFPPELAVIRDALIPPVDMGVEPIGATLGVAVESQWSSASVPVTTTLVPDTPPPPQLLTVTAQPGEKVAISAPDLPVAHPRAIGRYHLLIWPERDDGSKMEPIRLEISELPLTHELDPGGDVHAIVAAIVDPLGRLGATARVLKT
ncbi:hypothetical protein ACD578_07770 [Microvirga sp. RSM25]|uniref:hypothetical protein n=1 Tax=Microvirga sp. RSM25 TaxID=3273802 RepID=UPI00384F7D9B